MLSHALPLVGELEKDGNSLSPLCVAALTEAGVRANPLTSAPYWGAALVAYIAKKSGRVLPDGPADPQSWATWGTRLAEPAPDSIVLLSDHGRQDIGIVVSVAGQRVQVLKVHAGHVAVVGCPLAQVFAVRKPPGRPIAQLPVLNVEESTALYQPLPVGDQLEHGRPITGDASQLSQLSQPLAEQPVAAAAGVSEEYLASLRDEVAQLSQLSQPITAASGASEEDLESLRSEVAQLRTALDTSQTLAEQLVAAAAGASEDDLARLRAEVAQLRTALIAMRPDDEHAA